MAYKKFIDLFVERFIKECTKFLETDRGLIYVKIKDVSNEYNEIRNTKKISIAFSNNTKKESFSCVVNLKLTKKNMEVRFFRFVNEKGINCYKIYDQKEIKPSELVKIIDDKFAASGFFSVVKKVSVNEAKKLVMYHSLFSDSDYFHLCDKATRCFNNMQLSTVGSFCINDSSIVQVYEIFSKVKRTLIERFMCENDDINRNLNIIKDYLEARENKITDLLTSELIEKFR